MPDMISNGPTWVVLADGRKARILEEPRRGADLAQIAELSLSEEERYQPQDRPTVVHDSGGSGRHGTAARTSLHEQEEENFLDRLTQRIEEGAKRGANETLVLIADPRALGYLRGHLGAPVQGKIAHTLDKNVVSETIDAIKDRLRALRLP